MVAKAFGITKDEASVKIKKYEAKKEGKRHNSVCPFHLFLRKLPSFLYAQFLSTKRVNSAIICLIQQRPFLEWGCNNWINKSHIL
jgi:hypothetical protein